MCARFCYVPIMIESHKALDIYFPLHVRRANRQTPPSYKLIQMNINYEIDNKSKNDIEEIITLSC